MASIVTEASAVICLRALAKRTMVNVYGTLMLYGNEKGLFAHAHTNKWEGWVRLSCETMSTLAVQMCDVRALAKAIGGKHPPSSLVVGGDNIAIGGAVLGTRPIPTQDIVAAPEVSGDTIHVRCDAMLQALDSTSYAMSVDDGRLALCGVFVDTRDCALNVVATDGRRMVARYLGPYFGQAAGRFIPSDIVWILRETLSVEPCGEGVALSGDVVVTPRMTFNTHTNHHNYPDYRQVLPNGTHTRSLAVDRTLMLDAAREAQRNRLSDGALVIAPRDDSAITLTCEHWSKTMSGLCVNLPDAVAVNPRYLIDTLKAQDAGVITLRFDSEHPVTSPIDIVGEPGLRTVIMPIRVGPVA